MRILLVEDDATLGRQLVQSLEPTYAVDLATDGEDGHFLGDTEPYDAAILDLGLPRLDGLTVLKRWRADGRGFPVLILTARDRWQEKVDGIDAGADDYLTKPFRMEELLARIRALIRRANGKASPELLCGPLRLDPRYGTLTLYGRPVPLTAHELRVLSCLMYRQGEIVSQPDLIEHVYALDRDRNSNTIEVFIGRLRRKLGDGFIETVRHQGYRLRSPVSRPSGDR
jgi:two-component system, OmpR family, response regulator